MDLGFWLAFLVAFHLLPCLSGNNSSSPTCPENFVCSNLGPFKFPFSNFTRPDCGLCMVDCHTHSSPRIKLDRWSEQWFVVQSRLQSNIIKLRDSVLKNHLDDKNCDFYSYDIYLPNSASISYSIKSNITLFRCIKNHSKEIVDHFTGYPKLKPCRGFEFYYKVLKYNDSQFAIESSPSGCSGMLLPVSPVNNITDHTNLFDLLTPDFDLEWHLSDSDECNECHREGGQCKSNETNQFHCDRGEKSNSSSGKKKNVRAISGICVAVGVLLIVLATLVTCYKKKKGIKDVLPFLSRNSAEPSSNPDLESGSVFFGVPVFSYAELEEATNNFDLSKELGDGGFGIVYYGKLRDGREVAIKRLYEHNYKQMAQFMNEVEILSRLRHSNLVSLYGCTSRRSRELLLVYEYIPNGTVADHLHGDRAKDQSLTWPVRMNIAIETAGALAYLHASDIIHRDVKTNNILLDHSCQVKVADFGLSRLFPNDVSHISTAPQGTPGYVDPEYHQSYQLTDKSDVYSFGVVLVELISSMPAVDVNRHGLEVNLANLAINRIRKRALNELIDQSLGCDSDAEVMRMTTSVAELAFLCVQLEKEMRPAMDEVLKTLKAIQGCKENTAESRGRMVPSSPESDNVFLLKGKDCPSSPNSVTDLLASGSSTNGSTDEILAHFS